MQYNPELYLRLGREGKENPRHLGAMAGGTLSIHNTGKTENGSDFYKDGTTGYHDHSSKGRQVTADDFMLMSAAGTVGGQRAATPNNSFPPPQSTSMRQPSPQQFHPTSQRQPPPSGMGSVQQHQQQQQYQQRGSPAGYPPPPQDRMSAQDFASQLQSGYRGGQQQQQQQHHSYRQQPRSERPLTAQEFASQMQRSQNYSSPQQTQSYRVPPSESGYSDRSSSRHSNSPHGMNSSPQSQSQSRAGMQITPADHHPMYGGAVRSRYPNCALNRIPGETDRSDAGYLTVDEYGNPTGPPVQPHSYAPDGTPLDRNGNPIRQSGHGGHGANGYGSRGGGPNDFNSNRNGPGKGMSIYGTKNGTRDRDGNYVTNGSLTRPAGGASGVSHYRIGDYQPPVDSQQQAQVEEVEPPRKIDEPFGSPPPQTTTQNQKQK